MLDALLLVGKGNSLQGKTRAAFPVGKLFPLASSIQCLFPFLHRKHLQGIIKQHENSTTWKAPKTQPLIF